MTLEPPFKGDAYAAKKAREIPSTLRDAAVTLQKSKMLRAAMGDEVVEHYVQSAEWEQLNMTAGLPIGKSAAGLKGPDS